VLVALATLAATVVVALGAAPAQAGWTDVGQGTRYRVCKEAPDSGHGWIILTRARKRAGTEDARVGLAVFRDGERRQRWASGWLRDKEIARGWVRVRRDAGVRLHLWQEAGDRGSMIGTAQQREVLRLRRIERCG